MKVCIVGNSHGSALVLALREGWSRPNFSSDHILIPGRRLPRLVLRDGRFRPVGNIKSMRTSIPDVQETGFDPGDYDAIWIAGLGPAAASNDSLRTGLHPLGAVQCFEWRADDLPAVTKSCMNEVIRHDIEQSGIYRFCRDALSFVKKIIAEPSPRPSEDVLDDPTWDLIARYGKKTPTVVKEYFDMQQIVLTEMAADLGPKVTLLPFPPVLADSGLTKREYSRKSDPWHMNAQYGRLVLDQLYQASA